MVMVVFPAVIFLLHVIEIYFYASAISLDGLALL